MRIICVNEHTQSKTRANNLSQTLYAHALINRAFKAIDDGSKPKSKLEGRNAIHFYLI